MKFSAKIIFLFALLLAAFQTFAAAAKLPLIVAAEQLSTRFLILDPNEDPLSKKAIKWAWDPRQSPKIALDHYYFYGNPSEVKLIDNGKKLLFSCSGGACGIIDIASGDLLTHVYPMGNPHSIEILPDGNLVTASSTGRRITLFDLKSDPSGKKFKRYTFRSAHGVVFDKKTQHLFGCGSYGLAEWKYDPEKVELILVKEHVFGRNKDNKGTFGGHDLYFDPVDGMLTLTGSAELCKVNSVTGERKVLSNIPHIKSASFIADVPTLLLVPNESWWNDTLTILDKNGKASDLRRYPHFRFYKVRWIPREFDVLKIIESKK